MRGYDVHCVACIETKFDSSHGPVMACGPKTTPLQADINGDGLDDLLICNERSPSLIYLQHANHSWSALPKALGCKYTKDRVSPATLKYFKGSPVYLHFKFRGHTVLYNVIAIRDTRCGRVGRQ